MSRGDLKIGLIGCGRLAQFVHLRVLTRLPGARIVALADSDEGRLANAQAMVRGAETFCDYHALLRSDSVEAVVICLPTGMHADAARAAFTAGKHVYLEKPIATDLAGADAVIAAYRASGRVGQIGFNYRYHPAYVEAKRRIATGELGNVVAVRSAFCAAARDLPRW
jgi:predicted dehydrogenase